MRSCLPTALLVIVTVACPAPAVAGDPTPERAAEPVPVIMARYDFNGRTTSIPDASGNGYNLRILSFGGGQVRPVAHGPGNALAFPGKCTSVVCPHVALQSATSTGLNPGTRDIAFGADVLLAPGQTSPGQNVLQKGYARSNSQYKLQIDGAAGRPSCVLVDVRRPTIRMVRSAIGTADGRWHRIRCERTGGRLDIYVDGVRHGSTTVPASLSVSNDRPLSIGAKGAYRDNDQFNGILDNVWVRIGQV
ncbi:LamG-like jellyroll fold domain-containing protein [Actinoplanes sp. DH11]|uniref:LamG-like jellyroll fold domain-containing protein n=1 Tax=Actinoplanes sp. DH11 TaxID=2857011 RepID=UPI001E602DA2|nr:LamG-like jellyroll fold domain-containing protein [Actinoplanes sp. DH11]